MRKLFNLCYAWVGIIVLLPCACAGEALARVPNFFWIYMSIVGSLWTLVASLCGWPVIQFRPEWGWHMVGRSVVAGLISIFAMGTAVIIIGNQEK